MAKQIFFTITAILILINSSAQIFINEVLSSNSNYGLDVEYGKYPDWIEIYNPSDSDITLSGYYLSDNGSNLQKWAFQNDAVIPAKGFYTVWADNRDLSKRTNFKLSSNGESVYLSKEGKLIDSVILGYQTTDISYGRKTDGSAEFVLFQKPTYNTSNNTSTNYIPLPPTFSTEAGFYPTQSSLSVSLSNPSVVGEIYYTTNNEDPSLSGKKYLGAIKVSSTTVIRAVVKNGDVKSKVVSSTYFVNQREIIDLPIVSVSGPDYDLFSFDGGIFEDGPNIDTVKPYYGANYWLDKEVPVSFELFDKNGYQVVNLNAGIKIFGGWSRMQDQKSFSINCRKKYGSNRIDYKIFDEKNIDEFKNIVLRNSGNDFTESMMRDGAVQAIMKRNMDMDFLAFQPAVVFINGEYFGIMNIREKINEHYASQNYGIDPNDVDVLQNNGEIISGSNNGYKAMLSYVEQNGLQDDLNYAYIKNQIDISAYIDYVIAEIFIGNSDWPGNNIKFWRKREGGKWRYVLFDTDQGYGIWTHSSFENHLEKALDATGTEWPNPAWSTFLFRNLMQNQEFKRDFVQRFLYHLETTFDPAVSAHIIDSIASITDYELSYHEKRWSGINRITDIQKMKNWANSRPDAIINHLGQTLGVSGEGRLIVSVEEGSGSFKVNGFEYDSIYNARTFANNTISIIPNPKDGYAFSHWSIFNTGNFRFHIITTGSVWKYKERQAENNWKSIDFDDNAWNEGPSLLGYGDKDIVTEISYGGNGQAKYPAYFFRKTFTIEDPNALNELQFSVLCDDGAVVYINGVEVQRINMPAGDITESTLASAEGNELVYNQISISPSHLVIGENVIAVEVHQISQVSSDIRFDAKLSALHIGGPSTLQHSRPISDTLLSGDTEITLYFERESNLAISEIYYGNASEQYIELLNTGNYTIDLTGGKIEGAVSLSFANEMKIKPQQRILICSDSSKFTNAEAYSWSSGNLSPTGTLMVYAADGFMEDSISYSNNAPWPATTSVNSIELKDQRLDNNQGGNWQVSLVNGGTPGGMSFSGIIPSLFINEAMPNNQKATADDFNQIEDWIEIYNPNNNTVDIGGLYLSDNISNLAKYRISPNYPDETTIPANGYKVMWLDNDPKQGVLHANFALNRQGETIYLTYIDWQDTIIIDQLTFGSLMADFSFGRYPDGSDYTEKMYNYTPDASNEQSELITGIYINEVMASNTDAVAYEDEYLQWIEIYNDTDESFDLATFYLSNTAGNYALYQFPSGKPDFTTVPAKGFKTFYLKEYNNGGNYIPFTIENPEIIELYLSQQIKTHAVPIDQFTWYWTLENASAGRFPDGSSTIRNMPTFTPNDYNSDFVDIDIVSDNTVMVGPNPAKEVVYIHSSEEIKIVKIVNSQGDMIYETKNAEINISSLPYGVYYLQIVTINGTFYKKIIKN